MRGHIVYHGLGRASVYEVGVHTSCMTFAAASADSFCGAAELVSIALGDATRKDNNFLT